MGENSFLRQVEIEYERDVFSKRKAFDSPAILLEKAMKYFEWCDNNPFYQTVQLKKPGGPTIVGEKVIPGETLQEIPVKRPYTEVGLCIWLGVNSHYFKTFVYKHTKGELVNVEISPLWLEVIYKVRDIIHNQQYEGAATGFFKESIVSKMLGLVEKQEVVNEVSIKEVFKIGDKEFEL